jgi:Na+/H+ antiporter NhaD/arsenite permease-like protein
VALTGAGLLLALRVVSSADAFHSEEFSIDWDVIFLLLGMMVIVGVIKPTGLFDFLAIWSAKKARGRPFRILVTLTTITAVASALLDNVTTVLLVAPVTFLICERLGLPVAPFLIAEALASNIGGTATLIGDPPNIIIASQAELSYTDFLVNLAPLVVVLMVVFIALSRWLFRAALIYRPDRVDELMALDEREALTDRPLLSAPCSSWPWSPWPSPCRGCCTWSPRWSPSWGPGSCSCCLAATPKRSCARSSGPPCCSLWGCSSWSGP